LAGLGYLLARPALRKLRKRVDPRRYNGAVFLGLNGIAVKSHGGTDAFGFANAISVAVDMVQQDFLEQSKDILNSLAVESDSKKAAAV
jgi:glycerol-3-phosphate acyltransferase PlsX